MTAHESVSGTIVFPDSMPVSRVATISIRVNDVSLADAAAITLAETVLRDVLIPPPDRPLTFTIPAPPYDPRARYSVRVHVDLDGDGEVSVGDFVNMQSYPVLTWGAPSRVNVSVKRVG